uniref:Uncharacterized protein n=1 Tax=Amblyomma parvum TaxID=251391 RepID=A0A023G2P9_AMBPA
MLYVYSAQLLLWDFSQSLLLCPTRGFSFLLNWLSFGVGLNYEKGAMFESILWAREESIGHCSCIWCSFCSFCPLSVSMLSCNLYFPLSLLVLLCNILGATCPCEIFFFSALVACCEQAVRLFCFTHKKKC